jgi:Fe2+ transport system protein FeoA
VLRTRRLWSTFLTGHLGYDAVEADDLACRLEHATPPSTAERLAVYLGDPHTGPLGRPIPPGGESAGVREAVPLSRVPVGGTAEIVSVLAEGGQAAFLRAESLAPGTVVTVCGAGLSGVLVEAGDRWVRLGAGLAELVLVMEGGTHAVG